MIQLLWGILNIVLLLGFFMICFRAIRLVRREMGLLASVILVVGLLSFVGASHTNSEETKTWEFYEGEELDTDHRRSTDIILEENMVSQYNLHLSYSENSEQDTLILIRAYSSTTGFIRRAKL